MSSNVEELATIVHTKMNDSGILISKAVLDLVIKTYNEAKVEKILSGESVEEDGIGVITPTWRRVSNAFSKETNPYTSKLSVKLDSSLKSKMNDLIKNNENYRKLVKATDL